MLRLPTKPHREVKRIGCLIYIEQKELKEIWEKRRKPRIPYKTEFLHCNAKFQILRMSRSVQKTWIRTSVGWFEIALSKTAQNPHLFFFFHVRLISSFSCLTRSFRLFERKQNPFQQPIIIIIFLPAVSEAVAGRPLCH